MYHNMGAPKYALGFFGNLQVLHLVHSRAAKRGHKEMQLFVSRQVYYSADSPRCPSKAYYPHGVQVRDPPQ